MTFPTLDPAHLSDDALEEYAMGTLDIARHAHLEYHVLVCAECCEKLEGIFCFVEAFKHSFNDAGSGTDNQSPTPHDAVDGSGQPRPVRTIPVYTRVYAIRLAASAKALIVWQLFFLKFCDWEFAL
jgi:hypothetical protein